MNRIRSLLKSRAVRLAVALLLLVCLYWAADWRGVGQALARLDPLYLAAGLAMFVPQTLLAAIRWRALADGLASISIAQATRHTLASSALNLVAPSKLGDLSKAAMLPGLSPEGRVAAVGWVAVEKVADVAALAGLCLAATAGPHVSLLVGGWLLVALAALAMPWLPQERVPQIVPRLVRLAALTLPLWILHLAQIDLFLKAAGVFVSWEVSLARVPLAIFAGLLPVSFCGVGTRDSALIWLFSDVAPAATMAAVGLLTALRYLVPGAVGIPLLAGPAAVAPTQKGDRHLAATPEASGNRTAARSQSPFRIGA